MVYGSWGSREATLSNASKLMSAAFLCPEIFIKHWTSPKHVNAFGSHCSTQPTPNIGGNAPGSSVSRPHSLHACLEFTLNPNPALFIFLAAPSTYEQYITVDMLLETLNHEEPPPKTQLLLQYRNQFDEHGFHT